MPPNAASDDPRMPWPPPLSFFDMIDEELANEVAGRPTAAIAQQQEGVQASQQRLPIVPPRPQTSAVSQNAPPQDTEQESRGECQQQEENTDEEKEEELPN